MSQSIEVKVPDIGDFENVDVIEVLITAGDTVQREDSLITLESDKATMNVPAPFAGTIKEIRIGVGDQVSRGTIILVMEGDGDGISDRYEPELESLSVNEDSLPLASESIRPAASPSPAARTVEPPLPPSSLPHSVARSGNAIPHASPAVRRFAHELGANLSQIHGTGPKGRILREDI